MSQECASVLLLKVRTGTKSFLLALADWAAYAQANITTLRCTKLGKPSRELN